MKKWIGHSMVTGIVVLFLLPVAWGTGYTNSGCKSNDAVTKKPAVSAMPLQLINGLPYIQISINGKGPYLFGFDSGFGAQLEIDTELAAELGIQSNGTTTIGDGSGNAGVTLQTGIANAVQIGNETFSAVNAILRNNTRKNVPGMEQVRGIVGIGMFEQYLLTIDYPGMQMRLEKGTLASPNEKDILSYEPVGGGIPEIKINVGEHTISAVIDTRSMSAEFKLPGSMINKLTFLTAPKVIGKGRTISSVIDVTEVKVKESIQLGQFIFTEPVITYPSLNESAIIGSKLLKRFIITIDQQNKRIRFVKGPEAVTNSSLAAFTGQYAGGRTITAEGEFLFIQRPGGTPLKMLPKGTDEFTLEMVPGAILKFERDENKKVVAMKVSRGDDNWETAKRE